MFENASSWSSSLYGCASTVKVTVKKATFFHNGTSDNLDNLVVQRVEEKVYKSEDDMPLWGVEDVALNLTQFQPIWGLLDSSFETVPNVSTIRAPSFYLLGSGTDVEQKTLDSLQLRHNIPVSIFPTTVLWTISNINLLPYDNFDFLGKNSLSLWLK